VVEKSDIINVSLTNKKTYKAVKVGLDPSTDLALLKIEATDLRYVDFADSEDVRVGEWVAAIGNPFSYLESTVTAGIVSAKGRDIDIIKGQYNIEEFIQTDAAINPGNSGGALVNVDGDLIGINTAIATPTGVYAGYSFAIPSNLVKTIIEDIKQHGNIERGRLGIEGFELNPENVEELNLDVKKGFYVDKVLKGSGAQFAGVLPGDIIVEANKIKIENFDDLYPIVEYAKVGDKIKLSVIRKNKPIDIEVYLKKGI
jgi:S1-C subfamily serine protease